MADQNQFPDPANEFALQQAQLARRRALAESLIKQSMAPQGAAAGGYQGGRVYMVGSPVGQIAQAIGGAYMGDKVDTESTDLATRQAQAQNDWQTEFNAATDPAEQQRLLTTARNRGLRYDLEKGFAEQEATRIEKGEQLAADRVAKAQEAEAARIERGEQQAADRVARQELRATPTQHITISGGAGAQGGFAGAAPVVGGDEKGNPIYRHTKSGQLFQYDDGGMAVPYKGAVGAKPAVDKPLNENQGNALIYGTRAAQAHNILDEVGVNYSPIKVDMARGAEGIPLVGSLTSYGLGENEQKVFQAQRNFINAIMRRESGAAIAPSEFDNARKQYFPQQGDSEAVKLQKKANRELVIKGLGQVAGPTGEKAIKAEQANKPPKPDTLSPAEQAELDQLRAKHGRK